MVGSARGEPRGGGVCRQLDQSSWGGCVEVQCSSNMHGASFKFKWLTSGARRETFAAAERVKQLEAEREADSAEC